MPTSSIRRRGQLAQQLNVRACFDSSHPQPWRCFVISCDAWLGLASVQTCLCRAPPPPPCTCFLSGPHPLRGDFPRRGRCVPSGRAAHRIRLHTADLVRRVSRLTPGRGDRGPRNPRRSRSVSESVDRTRGVLIVVFQRHVFKVLCFGERFGARSLLCMRLPVSAFLWRNFHSLKHGQLEYWCHRPPRKRSVVVTLV